MKPRPKPPTRVGQDNPGSSLCFLGLPAENSTLRSSRVAVLPIPYEATTSYGAGTRNGPDAIIAASRQIELYDPRSGREPAVDLGFHTLQPMVPDLSAPERMVAAVARHAGPLYRSGKFVLGLGGEHTITVGLVSAAARTWPDLCIVQIDAHADLRDEYEGTRFSHACAARRALEALRRRGKRPRLVQVGIRNISDQCDRFRKSQAGRIHTFLAEEIESDRDDRWIDEVCGLVASRDVYLTVDLDGLDVSIMPATGTPEPGGLTWRQTAKLIERLSSTARVVAADVVELAPMPGNHAPDFLAAKLACLIPCAALRG